MKKHIFWAIVLMAVVLTAVPSHADGGKWGIEPQLPFSMKEVHEDLMNMIGQWTQLRFHGASKETLRSIEAEANERDNDNRSRKIRVPSLSSRPIKENFAADEIYFSTGVNKTNTMLIPTGYGDRLTPVPMWFEVKMGFTGEYVHNQQKVQKIFAEWARENKIPAYRFEKDSVFFDLSERISCALVMDINFTASTGEKDYRPTFLGISIGHLNSKTKVGQFSTRIELNFVPYDDPEAGQKYARPEIPGKRDFYEWMDDVMAYNGKVLPTHTKYAAPPSRKYVEEQEARAEAERLAKKEAAATRVAQTNSDKSQGDRQYNRQKVQATPENPNGKMIEDIFSSTAGQKPLFGNDGEASTKEVPLDPSTLFNTPCVTLRDGEYQGQPALFMDKINGLENFDCRFEFEGEDPIVSSSARNKVIPESQKILSGRIWWKVGNETITFYVGPKGRYTHATRQ